jgi:hypothetical protein
MKFAHPPGTDLNKVARITAPSHHAHAAWWEGAARGMRLLGRAARYAGVTLGWAFGERMHWHWPEFSPSPQRPWDWEVDGHE